jgi:hypothetical protein
MHQCDLFEDLGPAVDAGFTTRRRIELDRTSRLTAEYEDISAAPQPLLHTITATLAQHYGVAYRYLWLNLYRTHRDSTSWHGDPIGKIQETSTVPVLSLGATRRFPIKAARGGPSVSLAVASGDLIVMGGRAQRDWRHSVPKQAVPAGPRISINFAPAPPLPSRGQALRTQGGGGTEPLRRRYATGTRQHQTRKTSTPAAKSTRSSTHCLEPGA